MQVSLIPTGDSGSIVEVVRMLDNHEQQAHEEQSSAAPDMTQAEASNLELAAANARGALVLWLASAAQAGDSTAREIVNQLA